MSERVTDSDVQTFRLGFFAKRIIVDTDAKLGQATTTSNDQLHIHGTEDQVA